MIRAFIGGAGTGKTYHLVAAAAEFSRSEPLRRGQRILGLTFMHGSRKRMEQRLGGIGDGGPPYRVSTIDSFCLGLVRRFRRHAGLREGRIRVQITAPGDVSRDWERQQGVWRANLATLRATAAGLVGRDDVAATLRAAYPLILIDEIQDCDGDLLRIVQGLGRVTQFVAAGDPFQYLVDSDICPAIDWLKESSDEIISLDEQHRTDSRSILSSALSIREGTKTGHNHVEVIAPKAPGLAAYEIQKRLVWGHWKGSAALICPVRPGTSKFFRETLASLSRRKADDKLAATPFKWEHTAEEQTTAVVQEVCAPFSGQTAVSAASVSAAADVSASFLATRCYRELVARMRLMGRSEITYAEIEEAAQLQAHAARVYRRPTDERRRAMTVHGAKNREFDQVFVLWPYEVFGADELRRRLLYNALTRARRNALILVQGKKRLSIDPALRCIC